DLNSSANVNVDVGASAKATIDSGVESLKGTVPETDVVPNVDTSVGQENLENTVIPESPKLVTIPETEKSPDNLMTGNVSDDNTVINSQSYESMKTVSAHLDDDMSAEKDKDADLNVIDVDDLVSGERSGKKTPVPSIVKRLRSNSGKAVATACEPGKKTKKGKKSSTPLKHVLYGPKKTWSKAVQFVEPKKKNLKRKEISSSDSDFDVETDATTSTGTSRKSIGGKKIPLNVEICIQQKAFSGNKFEQGPSAMSRTCESDY
ncbi:envelope-like protein, partial [Trifolium medium]|nr:envelope-like protein [Trifolium medium]